MGRFYKVVALKVDIFETVVADERHVSTRSEADQLAKTFSDNGLITVIIDM